MRGVEGSTFRYHPKCKKIDLIQSQFADDLLIFCQGDVDSLKVVGDILSEFFQVSGL